MPVKTEHRTLRVLLAGQAWLLPALALAQGKKDEARAKKLYCWNENGQRKCADSLPTGEAMAAAREEISISSGMRTGEVQRAMTGEERAAQGPRKKPSARGTEALAAETRRRTDQAMLTSFQSEDELRRVFSERIDLVDNSVNTARYNVASLRGDLVTLLRSAGERELDGKPVPPAMAENIRSRHRELLRQRQLQASFERQRAELDVEIADITRRYRELKGLAQPESAASQVVADATKQ